MMLVLLVIVILVALALQRYSVWRAENCRDIRYECRPSVRACEPGDVFLVFSNVKNVGRYPSPTLRIEERFPKKLNVLEAEEYDVKVLTNDHRIYNSTVIVRGRQQVKRFLRASISERGEYHFSFAEMYAGDFLGLNEFEFLRTNDHTIVIYPARIENGDLLKAFTNAVDEIAMKKLLLEDPISVCGYRDYTGREPMRRISWTQSAIRNELIVKNYDPVWQYSLTIVEERMIGYRLITNANITSGLSRFSSTGGKGGSFSRILYALGSAGNGCVCSVEQLLRDVCIENRQRDSIVFVSTRCDDQVRRALDMMREYKGGGIVTLYAEELFPQAAPNPDDTEAKGEPTA